MIDSGACIVEMHLSGCTGITGATLGTLIAKGGYLVKVADLSFLTQKEFGNDVMK